MERIFGRAWIYVGHDSQVAKPGDYIATTIGRQPIVMSRHRDGAVHVLFNRCGHRGAKVVGNREGNVAVLPLLLSRLDLPHRRHAARHPAEERL